MMIMRGLNYDARTFIFLCDRGKANNRGEFRLYSNIKALTMTSELLNSSDGIYTKLFPEEFT